MNHEPVRSLVEIRNALGLHLRPAAKFVQTADRYQSEIRVHYKGQAYDARSILDLASLAAERGSQLVLEAIGPDASDAVAALTSLVAAEFFEDDNGEPVEPSGPPPSAGASPLANGAPTDAASTDGPHSPGVGP